MAWYNSINDAKQSASSAISGAAEGLKKGVKDLTDNPFSTITQLAAKQATAVPTAVLHAIGNPTINKAIANTQTAGSKAVGDVSHYFSTPIPVANMTAKDVLEGKLRPNGDPLASTSDKIMGEIEKSGKNIADNVSINGILGKNTAGTPPPTASDKLAEIMKGIFGDGSGGGTGTMGGGIAGTSSGDIANPRFDNTFSSAQTGLLSQLQQQASGQGPSIAQLQQQQAGNKAMQNTLGAVRSGIGSNAALAARTAALAGGNQMADLANQSGMLRLKEQQDAQTAAAGVAAQGNANMLAQQAQISDIAKANQLNAMNQQAQANDMAKATLASKTALGVAAPNPGPAQAAQPSVWQQAAPVVAAALPAILAAHGSPGAPTVNSPTVAPSPVANAPAYSLTDEQTAVKNASLMDPQSTAPGVSMLPPPTAAPAPPPPKAGITLPAIGSPITKKPTVTPRKQIA